jgi:ArsR family transcriptional regulator
MTLPAHPIDAAGDFEPLARLCKAAGDPLRLEILSVLQHDSYGVLELCRIFGVRQPAMSHHLKVLADAGLVGRRREATSIFYHRAQRAGGELGPAMQALLGATDRIPPSAATARGIAQVQAERVASSQAFFASNADKFQAQQELIAPPEHYEAAVAELLLAVLPANARAALELGPGEGWLLPVLAVRVGRVLAIDNSAAMLARARATCERHRLDNVELLLGDSALAAARAGEFAIAVSNMVLHHTASPAEVLQHLAAALAPGGVLLLTDLCAHDQGWAREACGDLWLGFAPDDLARWAAAAGLGEGESLYLAQRNGFRMQLRVFHKPHRQDHP